MNAQQLEELRRATRSFLADRAALAFNPISIHRGVSRETPCTQPEVEAALSFLLDLGQIKTVPNRISAVCYYKIAAAGSLAHERGE